MLPGLMQDAPLQISAILTHAARAHGRVEIVSKLIDEPLWRYDWAGCERRSRQAAQMLGALRIESGDRVSSLTWNTGGGRGQRTFIHSAAFVRFSRHISVII
jgi:3-(methylthio)propionyl---CoA ligase